MSLIGSHDAYTSWSATSALPTQSYDNSQDVPYVAPQAPIVVTNPTTNVGTVLDSDFIDQIVRRNQENIYDSSKAQKIAILTDENDIAYAKQIDTDNLVVQNTAQDTLLATHTSQIDAIRDDIDNTIITNIGNNISAIDANTALLAAHTASIAANNAFMVQTDDSLTEDIDANTALITTITAQLGAVRNDIDNVIVPDIGNNMGGIDTNTADIDALKLLTSKMGYDNTTNPNDTWVGFNPDNIHLNTNTYIKSLFYKVDGSNWSNVSGYFQKVLDNESQINSINVAQTAMDANIYNQISTQVTNRTLASDGTVIRESIDARFNLYGLDTELVVRGEFFGNFTAGANNVKGHIRKAVFHNVDGTSVLHNDITFVMREGDHWKMTRYYWNPSSQTVITYTSRDGNNTLPEMRYIPDALNNVMPIGDITNTDDLTAEVIHSNFWTHANVNNTGNGQIIQNGVFTYHMRNLVYTPTTERIALKSVQDAILTTVAKITDPPAPYYNYNWFAMEGVGVNSSELRLPENSLIFAGSLYRTRENDNPQTKLIPYLDNQGRLNSGHLWEAEFANQAYGAANGEKYPNQYLAGLVPAMPIADVQSNLRYEYFLNGEGHWTRNYTNQLNTISTTFTQILNRVEDQITGLVAINSSGRTTSGGLVTFGGDAAITGSPAAIGYINELGRLDTARLFDQIFNDQVFGVEDPDTTSSRRKSNAYLSGLVPTAENVTDRTTKYLRADGTWSLVPVVDDAKLGNMNIQKVGADHTFIYHGDTSNYDGIRFGPGMFELNSGGGGTPTAYMSFKVDNQLFANFSRQTNDITFVKSTSFTNDIKWNPSGSAEVSLVVLYTDVETIKSDYQTSASVDTKIDTFSSSVLSPTLNTLYTSLNVDADTKIAAALTDYDTSAQVDQKISAITPDLSNYYTKSETDNLISQFDTSAEVDQKISAIPAPDLSNYYTKSVTDNLISQFDTSAEVDAKISAIPADPKLADVHREVYNASTGAVMWSLGSLGYISMPESHFAGNIFWKPTGQGLTNLNVMNDRVNTLLTDVNALPDFDTITSANKFCITNTANGGTISYVTPTTSDVNEGTNLYYTDDRVNARFTTALQGGEIANIVSNIIQAQTVVANSDIRLKEEIKPIEESNIDRLNPVEYIFKKDPEKRLRYGFIAQEVEEIYPELIHEKDDIKSINYLDMIALLVKENQDLKKNMINMTHILMVLEERLTRNCIF